jgi:hypothetical protein
MRRPATPSAFKRCFIVVVLVLLREWRAVNPLAREPFRRPGLGAAFRFG